MGCWLPGRIFKLSNGMLLNHRHWLRTVHVHHVAPLFCRKSLRPDAMSSKEKLFVRLMLGGGKLTICSRPQWQPFRHKGWAELRQPGLALLSQALAFHVCAVLPRRLCNLQAALPYLLSLGRGRSSLCQTDCSYLSLVNFTMLPSGKTLPVQLLFRLKH